MWTGVCRNQGWSRWPELLSNSNSYQGFISWGSVMLPHLLQTFNYKGIHTKELYGFSIRRLANSKQQVTEKYCGMFSCLQGNEIVKLLETSARKIIQEHLPGPLETSQFQNKLLSFIFLLSLISSF